MTRLSTAPILFGVIAAIGVSAGAQDIPEGDARQDVWLIFLPKSPIRSLAEYHHSYRTHPAPIPPLYRPVQVPACDLEIRRAQDMGRVARVSCAGSFREHRTLSEQDRRRIGPLPDGEYRVAFCRGDKRCSNVATLVVRSDYAPAQEPTLRLVPLEPVPGQDLRYVGILGTGPSPADPGFSTVCVQCPQLTVDQVRRTLPMVTGSFFPIGPGKQSTDIVDLERYVPRIALGTPHTVAATGGKYKSQPVKLTLASPLGEAWDRATPGLAPWHPPKPLLRGTIKGPAGKPASGYEVLLTWGAERYTEKSTAAGEFAFVGVPPGLYDLHVTSPVHGSWIMVEDVRITADQPDTIELTFERLFSFSGTVTSQDGRPAAGQTVNGTWKSPTGTFEFNDSTVTDAEGRYTLSAPLREASYVGISGTGPQPKPHRNVKAGRKDVDFSL